MAVSEADNAVARFPDSKEAKKLQQEIHDTLRPYASAFWNRIIDTDSNDLILYRLMGGFHLDPQSTLDAAYTHFDARFHCETAEQCVGVDPATIPGGAEDNGSLLNAKYATRFSDILFVNASAGAERQEGFSSNELVQAVGSGSFDLYIHPQFGFGFGLSREALFDTARIIDNHIRLTTFDGRLDWRFLDRWDLRVGAQYGWFTDSNERFVANTLVSYQVPLQRPRLRLSTTMRWLTYKDDDPHEQLNSGYFAPTHFFSSLLSANVGDSLFHRKMYYNVEVTGGVQKFNRLLCTDPANPDPVSCAPPFDLHDPSSGTDTVFGYELMAGWNAHRDAALEAYYGSSDYAQQVASGFTSHHYGFLVRISF